MVDRLYNTVAYESVLVNLIAIVYNVSNIAIMYVCVCVCDRKVFHYDVLQKQTFWTKTYQLADHFSPA